MTTVSTLISLTLSIGAYSLVFGAPFAVGFVGQLLAHESVRGKKRSFLFVGWFFKAE
jgi:hypothetical protein